MKLGAFSISLSVKDISVSKEFYEKLGFEVYHGDLKSNYIIMKNENTIIGLFMNMFEGNILTFNPGWDQNAAELETYQDVRTIQKSLIEKGVGPIEEIDEQTSGPASFLITDPDGNQVLIDQHV